MPKYLRITLFLFLAFKAGSSQPVQITVHADSGKRMVSPWIFGKNNVLPSTFLNDGSDTEVTRAVEAGARMVRQNGGNNSTKYNWRRKLSSHPDWYNNVYANNWDAAAKNLTDKMPGTQGMWSFQLLGKVAANTENNFPDWDYNQSQWWDGVHQNLAGGGVVNPAGGSEALEEGDIDLYLMDWPADSTVAILDHWFGPGGLGYDSTFYCYWNMDNEPEIWSGTHDDVMKEQIAAEEFMQLYFNVAKAARAKYPGIKLVGPVPANEWQWYRYGSDGISYNGKKYCWLEYFILRIAEEETASGVKLLDVLDIHYYPGSSDAQQLVQYHRVFFDRDYVYPEANGVKTVNGGWNNSINKEYIFGRCSDWLTKYMGADHGVTFGVSETGLNSGNANVQASFYASTMGEFMKNGVEIFTPWSWKPGMWETLHLFSRYAEDYFIEAESDDETYVSAYPTVNEGSGSMTIFLVNRHTSATKEIHMNVRGFAIKDDPIQLYTLSDLPSNETFVSHTENALQVKQLDLSDIQGSIQLEPLSVNALVLKAAPASVHKIESAQMGLLVFPNPGNGRLTVRFNPEKTGPVQMELYNGNGQKMATLTHAQSFAGVNQFEADLSGYPSGFYWIAIRSGDFTETGKFILNK
ncbi:MAG: glycoside hydrolase family 44 protein [Bacteroidota bacterium]